MSLLHKRIFSLDVASLVAGTKYRGQFEERIHALLKELSGSDVILFIDEIHTIVGAGSTQGSLDTANILKPALARGELQCIGATTLERIPREHRDRQRARETLSENRRGATYARGDARRMLHNGYAEQYEAHHCVRYTDAALGSLCRSDASLRHGPILSRTRPSTRWTRRAAGHMSFGTRRSPIR